MRSNLGTKSRLAAHILALILLILMLVYTAPEAAVPEIPERSPVAAAEPAAPAAPAPAEPSIFTEAPGSIGMADSAATRVGSLMHAQTAPAAAGTEQSALRPPEEPAPPVEEPQPVAAAQQPEETIETPQETQEPEAAQEPEPAAPAEEPAPEPDQPAEEPSPEPVAPEPAAEQGADQSNVESAEEPVADAPVSDVPAGDAPAAEPESVEAEPSPLPQPDESGSLVVAPAETGATRPVAAATPLPNANIEVLGDGVYWLSPRHDLETELAAIPELRSLILLAPLPGHGVAGFEHIRTEIIPADPADVTDDAAERFIHLTDGANRPVAIAPLPGARGAAFFKGAYLLHNRALSEEDMLREIAPELDDAGTARDDIIHRLSRLKN